MPRSILATLSTYFLLCSAAFTTKAGAVASPNLSRSPCRDATLDSWVTDFDALFLARCTTPKNRRAGFLNAYAGHLQKNYVDRPWTQPLHSHRTRSPTRVPAIAIGGRVSRGAPRR